MPNCVPCVVNVSIYTPSGRMLSLGWNIPREDDPAVRRARSGSEVLFFIFHFPFSKAQTMSTPRKGNRSCEGVSVMPKMESLKFQSTPCVRTSRCVRGTSKPYATADPNQFPTGERILRGPGTKSKHEHDDSDTDVNDYSAFVCRGRKKHTPISKRAHVPGT